MYYVITSGSYSDYRILGVTNDSKKAEEFVEKYNKFKLGSYGYEACIEEFDEIDAINKFECIIKYTKYIDTGDDEIYINKSLQTKESKESTDIQYSAWALRPKICIKLVRISNPIKNAELEDKYLKVCRDMTAEYMYNNKINGGN